MEKKESKREAAGPVEIKEKGKLESSKRNRECKTVNWPCWISSIAFKKSIWPL